MTYFSDKKTWGPTPKYDLVRSYKRRVEEEFIVIAGPCSVESKEQIETIADAVADFGANHLRGGVFRAGTYPGNNFGWIDLDTIAAFQNSAHKHAFKNIIEILDYSDNYETILKYADCVQVGARQMQNYTLLKKLANTRKRVFLKRNPGATLDEWLGAAEHLLKNGCEDIVLIERGSVSHVNHVRWDLSISMIPAIKEITDIPVIVDASHGTGRRDLVLPMTLAGVAAGADGILVEVHNDPDKSISDADQAIGFDDFNFLMNKVRGMRHYGLHYLRGQ